MSAHNPNDDLPDSADDSDTPSATASTSSGRTPSSAPQAGRSRDARDARESSRLDGVWSQLLKKALSSGYQQATEARETLRSKLGDAKLPKEMVNALIAQLDDTKSDLMRVVAKELRSFLEATDLASELQKLLTSVSFEIRTEVRFVPNDSAAAGLGKPNVQSKVKLRRDRSESVPPASRASSPPPDANGIDESDAPASGLDDDEEAGL